MSPATACCRPAPVLAAVRARSMPCCMRLGSAATRPCYNPGGLHEVKLRPARHACMQVAQPAQPRCSQGPLHRLGGCGDHPGACMKVRVWQQRMGGRRVNAPHVANYHDWLVLTSEQPAAWDLHQPCNAPAAKSSAMQVLGEPPPHCCSAAHPHCTHAGA